MRRIDYRARVTCLQCFTVYVIIYVSGKRITPVVDYSRLLAKLIHYGLSLLKKQSYTTRRLATHAPSVFNASFCGHATLYIHMIRLDT